MKIITLTLMALLLLTACSESMTNAEVVFEINKCVNAGMRPRVVSDNPHSVGGNVTAVQCRPRLK